ncbi:type-F conjugative transfer system secretin TraK [Pseudorhodoferax sp. Leaf267]|uniref:type-F conjugative transfer system secretin TraK n=1 Tax=Pseudorhodoferax sp. Leaf267 TaxID=1736316 RepID=UPI0006FB9A99|nr:type-F conjugative transfer system secretin TraK [Pseudorhodoferax sp. Leaf267]KQP23384.1 conjugal transfer pilus assembly protein TraK [Pseudorhodoferax sp. Leaf267]
MRSSELPCARDAQRLAAAWQPVRPDVRTPPPSPADPHHGNSSRRLLPSARRILLVTALAYGLPAQALQVVEASDGVAAEAIVSVKEPTRLRIEGAAITDVFGNIHSSHCGAGASGPGPALPAAPTAGAPINPAGDVIVACDRDKGEVYLRPVGDGARPINLFVSSATATYTLLLRRADTPADTIVLRDKAPRALRPLAPDSTPAGPAPNHVRTMKALLVAMASDRVPSDIRVEETQRPLQLWAEARLTLLRLYEGRGFVGEKYALQNISAAPMVLAEPEFDRPADRADGEVAGIAIEQHNLRPGESTSVYVLRRGGPR